MGNCINCFGAKVKAESPSHSANATASGTKPEVSTNSKASSTPGNIPNTPRSEGDILQSSNVKSFSFTELKAATRNFRPDSVLGEGGFGSVFKGWIDETTLAAAKPGTGMVIAVKRLNQDGYQGHREWLAEVNYLGQLTHPNLVKLIGYCLEDEQRLLVYEFMPRGSLENHLFRRGTYFHPLSWSLRMKVALGAARGLAFLHSDAVRVIYRDFKTSNVLLDSDYNAKLSDFGLARDGPSDDKSHVSTRIMGTQGYAAPEYLQTGHLTTKSDIYSFGVVMLELLSGQRTLDKNRPAAQHNLVEWAKPHLQMKSKRLHRVIDSRLQGQFSVKSAERVAYMTLLCLSPVPRARPSMAESVMVLDEVYQEAMSLASRSSANKPKDNESTSSGRNRRHSDAAPGGKTNYPRPSDASLYK